jgi:hypothetical protein
MERRVNLGMMPRKTRNNLFLAIAPFLVAEAIMVYPALHNYNYHPFVFLLAPISLLVLAPVWAVQYGMQSGQYGGLLVILSLDVVFVFIMVFSILRNHKIIGGVCIFIFIFLCMGFVAAGD